MIKPNLSQGFALNYLAHSTNLLMQDLVGLFEKQFDQAKETEMFFRLRYQPRRVYEDGMVKGDTRLIQVCFSPVAFCHPVFPLISPWKPGGARNSTVWQAWCKIGK